MEKILVTIRHWPSMKINYVTDYENEVYDDIDHYDEYD